MSEQAATSDDSTDDNDEPDPSPYVIFTVNGVDLTKYVRWPKLKGGS